MRPIAAGFVVALVALVLLPTGAGARAAYKESDPADESTIAEPPSEVWAEFTEPPSDASHMEVYDPCGVQVDTGDSRPDGYRLYVGMSSDGAGTYRVEFFVNSEIDTHNTRGEFTFTVSSGPRCDESVESERESRDDPGGVDDPAPQGGDTAPAAAGDAGGEGDEMADGGGGRAAAREKRGRNDQAAAQAQSPPPEQPPEEPNPITDIPLGAFLVGLTMAAGIGAAGGLIYAGIMGYSSE